MDVLPENLQVCRSARRAFSLPAKGLSPRVRSTPSRFLTFHAGHREEMGGPCPVTSPSWEWPHVTRSLLSSVTLHVSALSSSQLGVLRAPVTLAETQASDCSWTRRFISHVVRRIEPPGRDTGKGQRVAVLLTVSTDGHLCVCPIPCGGDCRRPRPHTPHSAWEAPRKARLPDAHRGRRLGLLPAPQKPQEERRHFCSRAPVSVQTPRADEPGCFPSRGNHGNFGAGDDKTRPPGTGTATASHRYTHWGAPSPPGAAERAPRPTSSGRRECCAQPFPAGHREV